MECVIEPDGDRYRVSLVEGGEVLAYRTVASQTEADGLCVTALSAGVEAFEKDSKPAAPRLGGR